MISTAKEELNASPLIVEHYDWQQWGNIAGIWSRLVEHSLDATFFVSAEWVTTWLEEFGATLRPSFFVFSDRSRTPVGACALISRRVRRGPFTVRRLYLNTSGEDPADSPCIEFNTLLCDSGYEGAVAHALRKSIEETRDTQRWDEFVADGFVGGPGLDALRAAFGSYAERDSAKSSYYIDLEQLRTAGKPFQDTLTSKERTHVRQSLRKYACLGDVGLQSASTVEEALRFLDELASLHQKTWADRGFPGSFSSDPFVRFHRNLIQRCFRTNGVQLLRVRAGQDVIGVVYNFVFRGKVYFYQCGYDYSHGKRLSPGFAVQALAIQHAADIGLSEYDMMAGDVEYKRKLARDSRSLHWVVWQKAGVKLKALELLRKTKHRLQSREVADASRSRAASSRDAESAAPGGSNH